MASSGGCYAGLLPDTWFDAEEPLREVWVLRMVHRPIILSVFIAFRSLAREHCLGVLSPEGTLAGESTFILNFLTPGPHMISLYAPARLEKQVVLLMSSRQVQ